VAAYSNPKNPDALIFTMREGGPLVIDNYRRRIFARAVAMAGLDPKLTPHDLRDTSATLAFKAGATVREVQLMLGHSDLAITLRRYTGVLDSMKAATEAALDQMFLESAPLPSAQVVPLSEGGVGA
jgi:integrase